MGSAGNPNLAALDTVFGHDGSVLDSKTGLQRKGQRWYSPDLGRFLSEDPIQHNANWYVFAGNDPINTGDPTGLFQQGHPLLAGGFSGGVLTASKVPTGVIPGLNATLGAGPYLGSFGAPGGPTTRPVTSYSAPTSLAAPRASDFNSWSLPSSASSLAAPRRSFSEIAAPGAGVVRVQQVGGRVYGDAVRAGGRALDNYVATTESAAGAFLGQVAAPFVRGATALGGGLVDALLPPQEPGRIVTRSNGAKTYYMGEGASTGALANQALLLSSPWAPRPAPNTTAPQVLRGPVATTAPGKNFIPVTHVEAAAAEFDLIRTVQKQGEVILRANRTVTSNGADLITYNPNRGQVTLWDSKTTVGRLNSGGGRSPQTIAPSPTLANPSTLNKALVEARDAVQNSNLSGADRAQALRSIQGNTFRKVTAGAGNARNSIIDYGP